MRDESYPGERRNEMYSYTSLRRLSVGARQNETSLSGFPASEVVQTRRQMEVDGFDRALDRNLERCLPVDDVDAMDEASSAGVEKVSLQRTIAAAAARNMPRLDPSNAAQYPAP